MEMETPVWLSVTLTSLSWLTTSGGTSLTVQLKLSVAVAPLSSLAVTVTRYAEAFDAAASMTPTILPPASIESPGGSPVALKVKVSLLPGAPAMLLGSVNTPVDRSRTPMLEPASLV